MFLRKLLNQNYSGKSTNLTKNVVKCFDESKFVVFESKHHAWFYWKEHNILMVKIAPVLLFQIRPNACYTAKKQFRDIYLKIWMVNLTVWGFF